MAAFYQVDRWLYLKSKLLDQPAYSREAFHLLSKRGYRRALDCGCGVGDFVRVMMDNNIHFDELHAFDIDETLINLARQEFKPHPGFTFHVHNLYNDEANKQFRDFDLVTAQALLEHTNMEKALPILKSYSKPGGLLYFPHNYTSPTMFFPVFDNAIDSAIIENFDRYAIENQVFEGEVCGDCHTGGKLFNIFRDNGFEILLFASSDWLLYPKGPDGYSDEEKEILYILLDFFYDANKNEQIPKSRRVSANYLEDWRIARFRQIEDNQLVYICPQTSILVQNPA